MLQDAKKCKGFNKSDEEILKLASHISNFRYEGSIGGDCWGGSVCSYYSLYLPYLNLNGHGGEGVNNPFFADDGVITRETIFILMVNLFD